MKLALALATAWLALPVGAQQQSDDIQGYGYGTQPGQEANAGAKQATRKGKKASTAPQDERGAASARAAEQEGSAAGARSRTHAKPARKKSRAHRGKSTRTSAPAETTPAPSGGAAPAQQR